MMMKEIAAALGLSPATVSLCLSERHHNYRVSQATVARVRAYAERVGYQPNALARRLRRAAPGQVGLVISQELGVENRIGALRLAMRLLEAAGREFIVQMSMRHGQGAAAAGLHSLGVQEVIYLSRFIDRPGIAELTPSEADELEADLHRMRRVFSSMRVYAADYPFPADPGVRLPNFTAYGVNREHIYIEAASTMLRRSGGDFAGDVNCLYPGVRRIIEEAGHRLHRLELSFDDNAEVSHYERGRRAARRAAELVRDHGVRTFLIHNDQIAAGLMKGLLETGIDIPGTAGIIGFDDGEADPFYCRELTSIRLPLQENVRSIVAAITEKTAPPPENELPARIVWRGSTC